MVEIEVQGEDLPDDKKAFIAQYNAENSYEIDRPSFNVTYVRDGGTFTCPAFTDFNCHSDNAIQNPGEKIMFDTTDFSQQITLGVRNTYDTTTAIYLNFFIDPADSD